MARFEDYFFSNARISRRALARFAEEDPNKVDGVADDLGFGQQLTIDEAEELLGGLESDVEPEDDGTDAPTDEDEDEDEP